MAKNGASCSTSSSNSCAFARRWPCIGFARCVALQRQRNDLLGFAKRLDGKLAAIAQQHGIAQYWVRQVCRLHKKKPTSTALWQRWN